MYYYLNLCGRHYSGAKRKLASPDTSNMNVKAIKIFVRPHLNKKKMLTEAGTKKPFCFIHEVIIA